MVVPKVPFSFIVKAIVVSYTGVVLGTIGAIMGLVLDLISPREIEEREVEKEAQNGNLVVLVTRSKIAQSNRNLFLPINFIKSSHKIRR